MKKKLQKKKGGLIQHFYDDLFKDNYYVLLGVSRNKCVEIVKKELNVVIDLPGVNISGRTSFIHVDDTYVTLIWTKNKKPSIVAHEVFHAIEDNLRNRGISLGEDSCEVFAYAMEWLMRCALS